MQRTRAITRWAAMFGAIMLAAVTSSIAHADIFSYSITVPTVNGAKVCLTVDGSQTCQGFAGVAGGTLTLSIDGTTQGGSPTFTPQTAPADCGGKAGAGISLDTGSFGGSILLSVTGTHPVTGEPVDQPMSRQVSVDNHTVSAAVCQL